VREIVDERKLVQREPHLSLGAYGAAKVLHAALMAAGQSLILTLAVLVSAVVGLPLFTLWAILFLTTVSGALLALLLSALCDESATALAWFPLVLVPQVVFGGLLFPYGPTRPFVIARTPLEVVAMPDELLRKPVESGALRAVGGLAVSRWALEGYAAQTYEQDLSDPTALKEAMIVASFVPLTLSDAPVADRLLEYGTALTKSSQSVAPPDIDAGSSRYLLVLAAFAALQAAALIVVLPIRDPRRV
jgi:hypothetical protein